MSNMAWRDPAAGVVNGIFGRAEKVGGKKGACKRGKLETVEKCEGG